MIGVLINATPFLTLDRYWVLAEALDDHDVHRYARKDLFPSGGSRCRRLLLAGYVLVAAVFDIAMLVAAFIWVNLFGQLIAALW